MASPADRYRHARGPIGLRVKIARPRGLARWFREFGEDAARQKGLYKPGVSPKIRNEYIAQKAAVKLATLSKTTKELRAYFKDFGAEKGYALDDIRRWPLRQVHQVEKYGEYLHHLKSQPHVRAVPRTKKQKIGLQTFTGQYEPRQRAYAVHKTHPDEQVLIDEHGHVTVERKVSDKVGWLRSEFYFFRTLLGYQPMDWDEVYAATAEILPFLPEGMYFVYSTLHGEIDASQPKRSLLSLMARYLFEYARKKFAHTIAGFKRIADQISPDQEYEKIYYRRRRDADRRKKQFDALVKKVSRPKKKSRKPK